MLRVKIPGGITSPAQLRAIGEISNVHGRGEGELTTRQNVQLHYIKLGALPDVFDRMHAAGLTSAGACGDTVRNITGCPLAGLAPRRAVRPDAGARRGGGVLLRQPRLLRPAAQAQDRDHGVPRQLLGAGDQLHRAGRRDRATGAEGSACSSAAGSRRCRGSRSDLGIWVAEGGRGHGARRDPRRVARRPALPRLARQGAAQVHDRRHRPRRHARAVEQRLGRTFEDFALPPLPPAEQPPRRARAARRPLTTSACRCTSG